MKAERISGSRPLAHDDLGGLELSGRVILHGQGSMGVGNGPARHGLDEDVSAAAVESQQSFLIGRDVHDREGPSSLISIGSLGNLESQDPLAASLEISKGVEGSELRSLFGCEQRSGDLYGPLWGLGRGRLCTTRTD